MDLQKELYSSLEDLEQTASFAYALIEKEYTSRVSPLTKHYSERTVEENEVCEEAYKLIEAEKLLWRETAIKLLTAIR